MTDNFVNLHNHSDYSLLDGFGTVDEYIARAVELEQPALGLTDHGNVCGLYSFVNKCHKAGIKPIPGIEAYIAPVNPKGAKCHKPIRYGVAGQESIDVSGNGSYLHMTLFAMNKQGMKSLYALVREASEEGNAFSHLPLKEGEGNFYTKPRMDMDMLAAHNAGLIATTGCPSGEIQTRFRLGQDREAYDYATRMAELFDGRYFVEIMDHSMKGNDIERNVLPKLIKLADDLHLPLIATNDAHYCRAEDAPHHEEMLCSNSKAKMTDPTYEQGGNRFAFNGNQYYLKSSADMLTIPVFQEHPEAVENTVKLADMVEDINFELEGDLRPEVKIPDGYDEVSWFKHKIKEGFIKKRVQAGASKEVIRESQKRIAHELPVFTENNFAQYMLVVQDYINWAREHGILVGFGRGSVGGSEIAYLMNISDTDPIRHNLMFERFLNPERISPPDVDTDFAASRRDEVVDYVKEKYGEDHIANIITFNRFLSKTALNDMARIYGIPIFEVNKADSLMPESKPGTSASFDDIFNEDGKFHSAAKDFIEYVDKPEWKPVIEAARAIEGRIKTTGVHACGLIMSSHPITDAAPFTYKHNPTKPWGSSCCQWTYEELESIGLIKMDFLSLSDLDLVADTIANIKHTHDGKAPDMWELVHGPMDDKPTYDMLSRGETMNVFQLSSEGMQALFKRMQPTCFEDIQASVALYRPGPMGMNAHTQYADRKAGREKDIVINPELDAVFRGSPVDDVLKPTHGLCVPAYTMIFDASTGKNVKIKDFIQGHMTKSWNEKTGLTSFNKVSHVIHTGYKDVIRIILSNNESIEISTTHPMFTQRGWVQAKDLKTTDSLASSINDTKDMPNLRWTNISHIENAGKMDCYDITVDNDHTFFINGFITHNCLYQEEVMNISRFLSGFTWGQADALRKGMGHKKIEVLNEMEPKFIEGAVKNGYPRKETKELWEYLKKFGEYGFNASHAASYGIIAYETAYLKCHYPAEFMAAVLTDKIRKAKSPDDVKNALREVRELGLKVAAIDIDASDVGVSAVKKEKPDDPDIVFGISGIKGVSPSFAEKFVKVRDAWHKEHGRNYASIDEFMRSLPSDLISKRLIEGLAVAGAFDKFGVSRRAVYTVMPEMLEYYKNEAKQKEAGKSSLFDLFDDDEDDDTANANTASTTVSTGFNIPDLPDWDWIHKLEMEEEKLGVFVSGHPLSNIGDGLRFIQIGYAALDDKYGTVITVDDVAKMNITSHDYNGRKYYDSLPVRIIASVADINVRTNKRGSKIIDGRLESERNSIPFRVSKDSMDDVLAKMGTIEAIMKNHVYIISGNITIDWNGNHMMAVDSFDEVILDRDGRAPIWIHMLARHVRKKDSPGYMKLMRILNNPKNKGDIPVMIHVRNEDKSYGEIDTGCRVSCNDDLIMSLEKLIGTNHFGRWSKSKK